MEEQVAFQRLLNERFIEAKKKNPRFSLRAFARQIKLNPGALSAIMNGKRAVSHKLVARVAERLYMDPQERSELLMRFPRVRRSFSRAFKGGGNPLSARNMQYLELSAAQYRVIGDWEHYAILSLMNTVGFRNEVPWIAERLGISKVRTTLAVKRLISLGMIQTDESGFWQRSVPRYRSTDDVADLAIQKSHEQALELAKESLTKDDIAVRDHTAITMAIDPKQLPRAKELIRQFQDDISELLESGSRREVYRFTTQLVPVTRTAKGNPS